MTPRTLPVYVPMECQVHACNQIAAHFCQDMREFVCEMHREQLCFPKGHRLLDITEGLKECIAESERNRLSAIRSANSYGKQARKYRAHLGAIS